MDKELLGNLRTYSGVYEYVSKGTRTKEELFQYLQEIGKEWSGVAEFLGNIIAKYADVVDLDALPEPEKYLAEKRFKSMYKKYMEHSKLQRKGVKWVDYPNIWC